MSRNVPPRSVTQGWWTNFDGTPAGADIYLIDDPAIINAILDSYLPNILDAIHDKPAPDSVFDQDFFDYHMDGVFHQLRQSWFYYSGNLGPGVGFYKGYEINYLGYGMGVRATGFSLGDMDRGVYAYRAYNTMVNPRKYSLATYSLYDWARVGYNFMPVLPRR